MDRTPRTTRPWWREPVLLVMLAVLGALLALAVYGVGQVTDATAACRARGGVPARSLCLGPGALR